MKRAYVQPSYTPPAERKAGKFEEYEVREALSTLVTAAKIRKNPALMRLVRELAKKQVKVAQTDAKNL